MSKPHGKSKDELARMKMSELLQLVKNHNLAKHIHLYRRMKKAELIENLTKYKSSVPTTASAIKAMPPSPEKPVSGRATPRAPKKPVAAVARIRKPAPVVKSKKPAKRTTKARRNPPLYSKEEGGLAGGARADFERVYGKMTTSKEKAKASKEKQSGAVTLGKRQRRKPKKFVPS